MKHFDPPLSVEHNAVPRDANGRTDYQIGAAQKAEAVEAEARRAAEFTEALQEFGKFERTITMAVIDGFAAISQMLGDIGAAQGVMAYRQDPRAIKYDNAKLELKNIEARLREFVKKPKP
jgi:hypothetical protein